MNRFLVPLLLALAVAPLEIQAAPNSICAPKTRRHTVLECYDLLPGKFFEGNINRRDLVGKDYPIAQVDNAHDFLQSGGEAAQSSIQVAIFRFRGTELVGVSARYEMGGTLNFYRFKNGRLRDVTSQILPLRWKETQIARLPRIGTTIHVSDQNADTGDEKPDYDLLWRSGRFVVRRR